MYLCQISHQSLFFFFNIYISNSISVECTERCNPNTKEVYMKDQERKGKKDKDKDKGTFKSPLSCSSSTIVLFKLGSFVKCKLTLHN
jgi:hypothetical protein